MKPPVLLRHQHFGAAVESSLHLAKALTCFVDKAAATATDASNSTSLDTIHIILAIRQ